MPYVNVEYNGQTYNVPETGRNENNTIFNEIPGQRNASADDEFENYCMAFLMQDGNLDVPGGRYGTDTVTCAPIAIALAKIMADNSGETITYYQLNSDMGLVVNSHDDVAYTIREYGPHIGLKPEDYLEADDLVSDSDDDDE